MLKTKKKNYESFHDVEYMKIYTVRGFTSIGGVLLYEFINGYHGDGEEAGFKKSRFKLLEETEKQVPFSEKKLTLKTKPEISGCDGCVFDSIEYGCTINGKDSLEIDCVNEKIIFVL